MDRKSFVHGNILTERNWRRWNSPTGQSLAISSNDEVTIYRLSDGKSRTNSLPERAPWGTAAFFRVKRALLVCATGEGLYVVGRAHRSRKMEPIANRAECAATACSGTSVLWGNADGSLAFVKMPLYMAGLDVLFTGQRITV